ncbi:hypothetical protein [Streptomyces sp. NPDC007088]|uniref:hypothetical protein n=1 Tax=Streptomyces sp. NPDC007088 TaxID=3364773 RepID=UPI003683A8C4
MPVPEDHGSPHTGPHTDEDFAQALERALRETAPGLEPAPGRRAELAERGLGAGRVRLRRRRTAAVTGSVLALALVGAGGALATGLVGGDGPAATAGPAAAPATPATPTPTAHKSSWPKEGGSAAERRKQQKSPVSGQQVLAVFEDLLPEGSVTGRTHSGSYGPPAASLVFDDGKGKAAMGVDLNRYAKDDAQIKESTTCPSKVYVPFDRCTARTLPDGTRLMTIAGYEYPDRRGDNKSWDAYVVTREGYAVHVNEHNTPAEKDKPATRTDPPLSLDRLAALARSAQWQPLLHKLKTPKEYKITEVPKGPAARADITKIAKSLLPASLTVREAKDYKGYGYLVVDDGKGAGLVEINADSGFSPSDFEDAGEELPDGTFVTVRQGPAEKGREGVVDWSVQVLRTDGRRVVVSAYNAPGHQSAPSRQKPVLSLARIRALALDAAWTS